MNLNELNAMLAQAGTNAATPPGTVPNPQGEQLKMVGFMVITMVMLYFILNRSQTKKAKQQAEKLSTMKPGDRVVTNSGIVGTVVSVKDKTISLRSADAKMEVLKSAVADITERAGEAAASEAKAA